MAKVTSLTADEQETLSRLGKKLPKGAAKQDRAAKSPAAYQTPPKASTGNTKTTESYVGNGEQSPGGVMGHKSSPAPVKITAKKADKRS